MAYASAHNRPSLSGLLVAGGIQVLLIWLVLEGLAARLSVPAMPREPLLVAFAVSGPRREAPPPPKRIERERAAAPRSPAPAPRAVPLPKLVLDQPRPIPAAPQASAGIAASGTGSQISAGDTGSGQGTGTGGEGAGSGSIRPAVRVAGALGDRDYPREFAAQGAGGTVAIAFRVRSDGRVDGCQILSSSGYGALDSLTCSLVERRFRYDPARDAAGQSVESTLRTTFTWGTRGRD